MTQNISPRSRQRLAGLLAFVVTLGVIAWVAMPPLLLDRNVQALTPLECGAADEPAGTGMPAWPDGKQRYYTRQHWTEAGELKVEVWEFLSPGHVLVSAEHEVKGRRIVIAPRWEVPPGGAVAACHAKLGAEITFRGLLRGDYVIDAR